MKRTLCSLLILLLLFSGALPAAAQETAQEGTGPAPQAEDVVGAAGAGAVAGAVYADGISAEGITHNRRYDGYKKVLGIDVSEFQGSIDWNKVAADGVDFAILRVGGRFSQSGKFYTDIRFETNIKNALAAGIPVGVYYFSQAITEEEAREEAAETLRILGNYKDELSMPVFLDVEYVNNQGRLWDAELSRKEQTDIALAYCEAIEEAGLEAGVYAGFLSHPIDAEPLTDAGYSVWHAHWNSSTGLSAWYDLWQYSATGTVDGIEGDVDLDVWYRPVPESGFVDVNRGSWYYDNILYVVQKGLFNGMGDFEFQPGSVMSREMFVTVLYRLAGEPAVSGSSSFRDVTKTTAWYYKPVLWATQKGIVNGIGDGLFGVGQSLSRQEMVTLIYRYAAFAGLDTAAPAEDPLAEYEDRSSVSSWASEAMAWAVDNGIINGLTETALAPHDVCSRAQVAAVMQRIEAVPEAPEPTATPEPTEEPEPSEDPEQEPTVSPSKSPNVELGVVPGEPVPDLDELPAETELIPVGG